MRVLVVGAGAVGGYFGARLYEKGVDVTFLVREGRQKKIKENGLSIKSVHGDLTIQPKTILASDNEDHYDIILFGTKSYHFHKAIDDIKAFVGENTVIIPMLNGMRHLHELQEVFSEDQVLGGLCFIESTVDTNGVIIQSSPVHEFVYGEQSGKVTDRIAKIEELFSNTKATIRKSDTIIKDMWHKYMFITGLSGITTLFRSSIGPIREAEYGFEIIEKLFKEIGTIMRVGNAPIADGVEKIQLNKIKEMAYTMKSSMQRDMEKGEPIEGDHLQGYLLAIAEEYQVEAQYLTMVYSNLSTYEKQKKD